MEIIAIINGKNMHPNKKEANNYKRHRGKKKEGQREDKHNQRRPKMCMYTEKGK